MGLCAPYVSQSTAFSSSSSSVLQVGILFHILDQWRRFMSNRFMLIMVQGKDLQLKLHPPLLCNF